MKIKWVPLMLVLAAILRLGLADITENQAQHDEDFDNGFDTMSRTYSERASLYKSSSSARASFDASNMVTSTKRQLADKSSRDFYDWLDRMGNTSSAPATPGRKNMELAKRKLKGAHVTFIIVAKDGSGKVRTVQAAVNLVPNNNNRNVIIFIKKGIYREKVFVPKTKPFITFQGEGATSTFIEWGDTASTKGPEGQPLGTKGSASVAIEAVHFKAIDISFRNTAPAPPGGAVGKQAVALRIAGDMAAFYGVSFFGAQDTLYDHEGRHYFLDCYIEGSIDFIFGDGRSFYERCHLHSIASPFGSITAQHRLTPKEQTGFSIYNSLVTGTGTIYLGRAWGASSRVVYSFTYFADIILPQGWFDWNFPSREKTVFYGEYKCFGPGANRLGRVKWSRMLTAAQAKPFLTIGFINGEQWL
ncbi:hypothetical protein O6H91_11G073000 [Diphasiastrum complanatum]|uniref:Uncharacterized protein n=2 Tax=Diphasiastrum complanatum TaxID=34168 RepID=A0ACC2CAG2_DIPCM|nr:hypothetical protein O6H91_11G072900 [Diphasiastrum complanatum]KAJ7539010.1 hypothetical protein O6H91_11G073000 [Diphasiastrum complanatum]